MCGGRSKREIERDRERERRVRGRKCGREEGGERDSYSKRERDGER